MKRTLPRTLTEYFDEQIGLILYEEKYSSTNLLNIKTIYLTKSEDEIKELAKVKKWLKRSKGKPIYFFRRSAKFDSHFVKNSLFTSEDAIFQKKKIKEINLEGKLQPSQKIGSNYKNKKYADLKHKKFTKEYYTNFTKSSLKDKTLKLEQKRINKAKILGVEPDELQLKVYSRLRATKVPLRWYYKAKIAEEEKIRKNGLIDYNRGTIRGTDIKIHIFRQKLFKHANNIFPPAKWIIPVKNQSEEVQEIFRKDIESFDKLIYPEFEKEQDLNIKDEEAARCYMLLEEVKANFDQDFDLQDQNLHKVYSKSNISLYNRILNFDIFQKKIKYLTWSGSDVKPNLISKSKIKNMLSVLNHQKTEIWPSNFFQLIKSFRSFLKEKIEHKNTKEFILIIVIINTTLIALEKFFNPETEKKLSILNTVFSLLFFLEMITKILAFGLKNYCKEAINIFDGFVTIIGFLELLLNLFQTESLSPGAGSSLSAFRTLRLFRTVRVLRFTRLMSSFRYVKVITEVISSTIDQFIYIALILLLFAVIYTLIGMRIYKEEFDLIAAKVGYSNSFRSFPRAFLTVFQILTLENWYQIIFVSLKTKVSPVITVVYFISWILVGNMIFLNLFLAILIQGFITPRVGEFLEETESDYKMIESIHTKMRELEKIQNTKSGKTILNQEKILEIKLAPLGRALKKQRGYESELLEEEDEKNEKIFKRSKTKKNTVIMDRKESLVRKGSAFLNHLKKNNLKKEDLKIYKGICCKKSLLIFSNKNLVRIWLAKLARSPVFNTVITGTIIISSGNLILETYLLDGDKEFILKISKVFDIFFTIIFALELLTKSIWKGLIICKNSYLRNNWNQLDFLIIIASLFSIIFPSSRVEFFKILRLARALRPLQFVTHNRQLQLAVNSLLGSFGAIANVLIVIFIVFLMWAILGVSLLAGKLGRCSSETWENISKAECLAQGFKWKIANFNFENTFEGMITLFVLSSLEGWSDIMYTAMNGRNEELGPSRDSNFWICIYFVAFVLIVSLFLVNLFIGILGYKYHLEHTKLLEKEIKLLSSKEKFWVKMLPFLEKASPSFFPWPEKKNFFLKKLQRVVLSSRFEWVVIFCILINIVCLGMVYEGASDFYSNLLSFINFCFKIFFGIEATLKIASTSLKYYLSSNWNKLDFGIVLLSLIDIPLNYFYSTNNHFLRIAPQIFRVLRVLRVTRVLKLAKSQKFQGIYKIIRGLFYGFNGMIKIFSLYILSLCIFSVLGVSFFQKVTLNKSQEIKPFEYFKDFGWGFITVFKISTGEDWNLLMLAYAEKTNPLLTKIYFISCISINSFILLNMVVLVIVERFELIYMNKHQPLEFFERGKDKFDEQWSKVSERSSLGWNLKSEKIIRFMCLLEEPFGKTFIL